MMHRLRLVDLFSHSLWAYAISKATGPLKGGTGFKVSSLWGCRSKKGKNFFVSLACILGFLKTLLTLF